MEIESLGFSVWNPFNLNSAGEISDLTVLEKNVGKSLEIVFFFSVFEFFCFCLNKICINLQL